MAKQKPTLNQADLKLLEGKFLTKEDAKKIFLSKNDAKVLFLSKDEFEDFKVELKQQDLNYKSEIIGKVTEVLKEVVAFREEQTLLSHRVSVHSDQIGEIQKHLGIPASD